MFFQENIKIGKAGIEFRDKHGNKLTLSETKKKAFVRVLNWYMDLKLYFLHAISFHVPFHSVRKFFFRIAGMKIGKGSTLHMGSRFFDPRGVSVGEDTIIGNNCLLDGRDKLKIGNHVDIASEVMIYNSEHDINDPYFTATHEPVEIEDYVFIGPRAIILPGVRISKGAVVAAGCVVTANVSEFEIVGGVPGKVIGKRNRNVKYRLGRPRLFQ